MNSLSKLALGMVAVSMICTTACRSSNWQSTNDVAALQAQRRAKVEKSVGLKQSEAELQLARDAWTFGDKTACLSALDGILEREPGHVDALLLKAEVHLAKNEVIEADRSIAIALSHDPANTTAKRLSEIARTKQLAARPQQPAHQPGDYYSAPLPAGAVAQAAYSRSEPGTALIEDESPQIPTPVAAHLNEPMSMELPVPGEAFNADAPETALATDAQTDFPRVLENLPAPGEAFAAAASGTVLTMDDQAGFAEVDDARIDSSALQSEEAGELLASAATEALAESEKQPVLESVAEPTDPMPVTLTPEEAAAYGLSDDSAGTAEVSDQATSVDSQPAPKDFKSALASRDTMAALAAVEVDITNNPDDPQIPISATAAALEAKQPETAASIARLGIAFHPSCAGLHRNLGAALYRSGNYTSSQVALQQALSLDNTSALAYFLMGSVSEKLGDTEAAQSHFKRAAELDPNLADGE